MSTTAGIRLVAAGMIVAVALAACGSTATPAPSSAPASAGTPSVPAETPAPSASAAPSAPDAASPAPSEPGASASVPPLTAVPDLEKMIPTTLAGYPVTVRSLTGADIVASGDQASIAALDSILKAAGKTAADYAFAWGIVKTGAATDSVIGVFRVAGADPAVVREALIAQAGGGAANVESGTIGGRSVQILRLPAQDGTLWSWYYWPKGDVLFYVQSTDPTIAEKVLAAL